MVSSNRTPFTGFWLILASLWLVSLAAAADLNDILMMKSPDCETSFDVMQCSDVPVDCKYQPIRHQDCCINTMPFCHIGVYNKAEIPDLTLSAWADADGCDTSSPAPLYCKAGYCTCLDATTTGSKDAKCSALWSTTRKKSLGEAKSAPSLSGCRVVDTLRYLDPHGEAMEIREITETNLALVMGYYEAKNYSQLGRMAVRASKKN